MLLFRALVESARTAGVDAEGLVRALGGAPVQGATGWIPAETMALAWHVAAEQSGDPDFGLHAAESTPLGTYGALEFAALSSTSLADALRRTIDYYKALDSLGDPTIVERDGVVRLGLTVRSAMSPLAARHFVEYFFAVLVGRARLVTSRPMRPVRVAFVHAAPASQAEHVRIFGIPVVFGADANELVSEARALARPLPGAQPELLAPLEQAAANALERRVEDVVARTRALIPEVLRTAEPGLAGVARRLGLGARTLQRRLGEMGTTYAQVAEQVRRELAQREVAMGTRSFGEIAFLLGFSEASAFDRAFRRWTGKTPSAYRAAASDRR